MPRKRKVKVQILQPGPNFDVFQRNAWDKSFGTTGSLVSVSRDGHTAFGQRPRVTLAEQLANRLEVAAELLRRRS